MKPFNLLIFSLFLFSGCVPLNEVDTTPPPAPQGIKTISLDNAIEISWLPSQAGDVTGYNVWRSPSPNGRFVILGSVHNSPFVDYGALNGLTYYYAISAYDAGGNESPLSNEIVYDTPRPEGYNVQLLDAATSPGVSGYSFSGAITRFDDNSADLYFENIKGWLGLNVWTDTDIQDMGYTASLDEITSAPGSGWSPTKSAEAIAGHTYVVWTWDNHYAKIRITNVTLSSVTFDWAFQTAVGNPELKPAPDAGRARAPIRKPVALARD